MSDVAVLEVAGKKFNVVKTGAEQAAQVVELSKWLSKYGLPVLSSLADDEGNIVISDGFSFIAQVIEQLDVEALLTLYQIILGCDRKFAEKHFDIATLIDAVLMVYEHQPSFRRLLSRFFSIPSSEQSTEGFSMMSEQPTDGQMTTS